MEQCNTETSLLSSLQQKSDYLTEQKQRLLGEVERTNQEIEKMKIRCVVMEELAIQAEKSYYQTVHGSLPPHLQNRFDQ